MNAVKGSWLIIMTDDDLMVHIAKGDKVAFKELYSRHGGHFLGYARSITQKLESAEEIVQEVWCKVIRLAPAYKPQGQFVAWAYTLIRHASLNMLRNQKRLVYPADTETDYISDTNVGDLEKEILEKSDFKLMKEKLNNLPDSQRIALLLFCVEGLSYDEIASEMETTASSVKSLIFRARQTLGAMS
jgi:RNA polymerase sigma factor (sigma-70 family)